MKNIFYFFTFLLFFVACTDENANKADEFFHQGEQKIVAGDYIGAEQDFSKAIELDPQRYTPYHGRGEIRFLLGKKQEALQDLKKAMELMKQTKDMNDPQYKNAYEAIKLKYEMNGGK